MAGRAHHRSNKGTVEDLDTDERPVDDDFEVNARSPMNHRVRDEFGDEEAGVGGELPGCPWCDEFERMGARESRTRRVNFQRDGEHRLHREPSFANVTEWRRLASSRVQAWPEQCVSPKNSRSLYRPARTFKPDRPAPASGSARDRSPVPTSPRGSSCAGPRRVPDDPVAQAHQLEGPAHMITRRTQPEATTVGGEPSVGGHQYADARAAHERNAREVDDHASAKWFERSSQDVSRAQVELSGDHDDRGGVEVDDLDRELGALRLVHPRSS